MGGDPFEFENTINSGSILLVSTLESQLALGDVVLSTSVVNDAMTPSSDSSIAVNDAVTWTSGNSLTFQSGNSILINADLNAGSGDLRFGLGFMGLFPVLNAALIVDQSATVTADTVIINRFFSGDFVGNSQDGLIGSIDFNGILNANVLDLQYAAQRPPSFDPSADPDPEFGGIGGVTQIDNPNNQIGLVRTSVSTGSIKDSITIVDSGGGLLIDAAFKNVAGNINITTAGDLTLLAGAQLSTATDFDIHLAAQGGSFINQAGASAVAPGANGRFLIYSDAPVNTPKGGLIGNPIYNSSFAANAPVSITQMGNRFLYTLAPTLMLTANSISKEVGTANPEFTFSVSGLVGDDQQAGAFTGAPTLSTTADETTPLGDVAIDIAQGSVVLSDFGYALNLVAGILSIEPAALQQLIVRANDFTRIFGDNNPAFTAAFTGFTTGQDESLVSGLQFNTMASQSSPVGTFTITPFGATADGFAFVYQPGELTINPRLLSVTPTSTSRIFGDDNPAFNFTFGNLAFFDNDSVVAGLTANTAAERLSNVGDYEIGIIGSVNNNYTLDVTPGNLAITPRPVTIIAQNATREFGDANPSFSFSTSEQVVGAPLGTDGLTFATLAVPASDIGNYPVTPSGINNPNYAVNYQPGNLSVNPAPLIFSAIGQTREYGLANAPLRFTDATNYKLGNTIDDVLSAGFGLTTTANAFSNVGNYALTWLGTSINPNYAVTLNDATINVTRAPLFIAPALSSRLYGDANPTSFELAAVGLRNDDTTAVIDSLSFNTVIVPVDRAVGSVPNAVSILAANATNYSLSFGRGTLNILPRPLTITANDFTREYGDANPTFTALFEGLASFDTESAIGNLGFNTTAQIDSIPGRFGITPSSDINSNYVISYAQGFLDITKAPLIFSLGTTSRVYGNGNDFALSTVTVSDATGFKLSDDARTVTLSNISTTATQQSGIGFYPITAAAFSERYELTVVPGQLTVTQRPLTLLISGGTPLTRAYGDTFNIDDNVIVGNLASFDTAASVFQIIDPTNIRSDIGVYSLTANILTDNYSLASFGNSDVGVQQRQIDVRFTGANRFFGDTAVNFFNFVNESDFLVPGDAITDVLATPSTATILISDVGDYAISTSSINSNYGITSVSGDLSITPRPLFVAINLIERLFGQANPIRYESLRIVDGAFNVPSFTTLDAILTVNAPSVEADIGNYALTVSDVNSNYDLRGFSGSMLIAPRPISLDLAGVDRLYGEVNLRDGASVAAGSLASFDELSVLVEQLAMPDERAPVGPYLVNELIPNNNYQVSINSGTEQMVISPRTLSLDLAGVDRIYGDANVFDSARVASGSLASFDDLSVILGQSLPDERAPVGAYRVSELIPNSNYQVSINSGNDRMVISPRTLSLDLAGFDRIYGDANVFDSARVASGSLASFDDLSVILEQSLPDVRAPVGAYRVSEQIPNSNYLVSINSGNDRMVISPRTVILDLAGFDRLYGDANVRDSASVASGSLASFEDLSVILEQSIPDERAPVGAYRVNELIPNSNYRVFINSGSEFLNIEPRSLNIAINSSFTTFGESVFPDFTAGGDGLASFDTPESVFKAAYLGETPSNAGYYLVINAALNTDVDPSLADNYTINSFTQGVHTVLPRPVTLNIEDLPISFTSLQAFTDYLSNPNLVLPATVENLVPGDAFDDAFPIIRYQITDADIVPPLPVMPTPDNVFVPTAQQLISGEVAQGDGVRLAVLRPGSLVGGDPVFSDIDFNEQRTIQGFATILAGFDTERNYSLAAVNNGAATFNLLFNPPAPDVTVSDGAGDAIDFTDFDPSSISRTLLPEKKKLTIRSGNAPPPGLSSLFADGDFSVGEDIITGFFRTMHAMPGGIDTGPGSLFREITRSSSGSLDDLTPFAIQRWFERNKDNPELMILLGEPLAIYAKDFLQKDPSTYTRNDQKFGDLLSSHLGQARDEVTTRVEANYENWLAEKAAAPMGLEDVFSGDVPWSDIMAEAAGDYIETTLAEGLGTAGSVVGGVGAGMGTAIAVQVFAQSILPFAGKAAAAKAAAAAGATATKASATPAAVALAKSNAAAAAMSTAGVGVGTVAFVASVVVVVVVGSVARGRQVNKQGRQEAYYEGMLNEKGTTLDVSGFQLEDEKGNDNELNQAIMFGALASMLFSGE